MCMILPEVIKKAVEQDDSVKVPHDTVIQELKNIAAISGKESEDIAMAVAVYMLGFNSYLGFSNLLGEEMDKSANDNFLKRIYGYAQKINKERI